MTPRAKYKKCIRDHIIPFLKPHQFLSIIVGIKISHLPYLMSSCVTWPLHHPVCLLHSTVQHLIFWFLIYCLSPLPEYKLPENMDQVCLLYHCSLDSQPMVDTSDWFSNKELIKYRITCITILKLHTYLVLHWPTDRKSVNVPNSIDSLSYNLSVNKFLCRRWGHNSLLS